MIKKNCKTCKKILSTKNFYFNKRQKTLNSECKKCTIIRSGKRVKRESKIKYSNTWLYKRYFKLKHKAYLRKITFNLSFEDFKKIKFKKFCTYCYKKKKVTSIDRVNNSIGYNKKNCVLACLPCNSLKSYMDLNWVENVYKIMKKQKGA